MKLATYSDGSRDGQLVVVSRDLSTAHYATGIASRLQQVLDDWNFLSPQLQDLYDTLNHGKARHAFAFEPAQCLAPLPRAYQWLQGAAYVSHTALMYAARGLELPETLRTAPTVTQGASDALLGAHAALRGLQPAWGVDFEAQLAAITADVPRGATPEQGLDAVRLLALANGIRLRQLHDGAQGHEFAPDAADVPTQPAIAFSPVAVTPDELGETWQGGRVHLTLQTSVNGRKVGLSDAGADMTFGFDQLIAHAARTRPLGAGSLIGSGAVSAPGTEKSGATEWPKGYHSLIEKRATEVLQQGAPHTGYLQAGDTVRMEMKGRDGQSVFGAIAQQME
jgi:fumarylacetoacetate (FAA) hydrolase